MPDYLYVMHDTLAAQYTVAVTPAPADASRVIMHRNSETGGVITRDDNLARQGSGRYQYQLPGAIAIGDSPIWLEFQFQKGQRTERRSIAYALAKLGVGGSVCHADGRPGERIPMSVTAWKAVVFDAPGRWHLQDETNAARIATAQRNAVKWKVNGQDIAPRGERVQYAFPDSLKGQVVTVEARLDEAPEVHGSSQIKVLDLSITAPDGSAAATTVTCGKRIRLHARVRPEAAHGTFHWSVSGDSLTIVSGQDTDTVELEGHRAASRATVTCRFHSRASEKNYDITHNVEVVKRNASLVWPRQGTHKQYVNLSPQSATPERGHRIQVKVTLQGGQRDDVVFAKIEKARGNSARNSPAPGIVGSVDEPWCRPGGGKKVPLRLNADQANHEALIDVELGHAGNDKFTLKVGGDDRCADQQVEITNARRIDFQIHHPGALPSVTKAVTNLADVAVEFRAMTHGSIATGAGPAGMRNWVGHYLVLGRHNKSHFEQLWARRGDANADPGVHIVVCDGIYHADSNFVATLRSDPLVDSVARFTLPVGARVMNPDLRTNAHPVDQVGWAEYASAAAGSPISMHPLTTDDVDARDEGREVAVFLPDAAIQKIEEGKTVRVAVRFRFVQGPFTGWSDGNQLLMVRKPDSQFGHTLVHEVGHTMWQTVSSSRVPPGLSFSSHGRTYEGHDHVGHHCNEGLNATQRGQHHYVDGQPANFGSNATCVMWGSNSNAGVATGKFCDKCKPFVIAEEITGTLA